MSEPPVAGQRVYRHSVTARVTHWLWALALLVLVMSGLQIFNASPELDASDKSDPTRAVLSFDSHQTATGANVGTTTIFGHTFVTTHVFGYTDDGMGGEEERAFPGAVTLPATQDLASGRVWHFFFGWVLVLSIVTYLIVGAVRKDLRELILRPSDIPKLLPMQLYYFRLRKEPPPHGIYNPLQKAAYTSVGFVLAPLVVLTGLALSPGIDAIANPLTWLLGGRQFARLWHFAGMFALIAFMFVHVFQVATQGFLNQMNSMITGRFRLDSHES